MNKSSQLDKSPQLAAFDLEQAQGFLVCGCDEAGRGPLAGDVVAGAVVFLSKGPFPVGLDDSKKLKHHRREELFSEIIQCALAYGIASCSPKEIDTINILQASLLAMRKALMQVEHKISALGQQLGLVLVDGNKNIPNLILPQRAVVKGDSKSAAIAAASILAKVERDRRMVAMDLEFPDYGFAKHKGYPTKEHYLALEKFGPTPFHRKSFSLILNRQTDLFTD